MWLVLLVILVLLLTNYASGPSDRAQATMTDFLAELEDGNVASVELEEASESLWDYTVTLKEAVEGTSQLRFLAPNLTPEEQDLARTQGVKSVYLKKDVWFSMLLIQILPIIIILGGFWFFMFKLMTKPSQ